MWPKNRFCHFFILEGVSRLDNPFLQHTNNPVWRSFMLEGISRTDNTIPQCNQQSHLPFLHMWRNVNDGLTNPPVWQKIPSVFPSFMKERQGWTLQSLISKECTSWLSFTSEGASKESPSFGGINLNTSILLDVPSSERLSFDGSE